MASGHRRAGDSSTEMSGKMDQVKGKVEEGIGNVKESIDDATN